MNGYKIPHFGLKRQSKNLSNELLEITDKVLQEGQFIDGFYTKSFEKFLRFYTGARYAITVHSGTQALYFIAKHLYNKLPKHEKIPAVVIPNLTYPATLNAFIDAGFEVVLGDTDKCGILSKDFDNLYYLKCVIGLYGKQPWDNNQETTIVDGAQHWLVADGKIGRGMAISFDPTKNLPATGNGGAVITNDTSLYEFVMDYKNNGKYNDHISYGTNSKLSELDCAHLMVRSKYLADWQTRRKQIAEYYIDSFTNLPIRCLTEKQDTHAYQKFVIYTDKRNSLHTHLITEGIESRIHYEKTLGELTLCNNLVKPDMLSVSMMLVRGVLSLPIYPELTDIEIEIIANVIKKFYNA